MTAMWPLVATTACSKWPPSNSVEPVEICTAQKSSSCRDTCSGWGVAVFGGAAHHINFETVGVHGGVELVAAQLECLVHLLKHRQQRSVLPVHGGHEAEVFAGVQQQANIWRGGGVAFCVTMPTEFNFNRDI